MKNKQATMQDVARRAGVSMMTVSRVLNTQSSGNSKVRSSTRQKVLEAVEALNYKPNISARSLAGSKSYFLGLLYDNPSAGYVSQLLLGALKKCHKKGYNLIVDSFDEDSEEAERVVSTLIEQNRVDGVILIPPICDSTKIMAALDEAHIPMVRIAPQSDPERSSYVCMDDFRAAQEITEHLISMGHEKIAIIIGPPDHGASRLRLDGFKQALKDHNIPCPEFYVEQGLFTYQSGFSCAESLIKCQSPPTAIFACNDDMAAAVVSAAHKYQLTVPGDLSVAGFDDSAIATTIWPKLTTIRQPIISMAEQAVELLTTAGGEATPHKHVLHYELILRDSVAKAS